MAGDKKKTNIIRFTNSRKYDFPPEITFKDGTILDTMSETRLLGVIVSRDLKWSKNTDFICSKARRKLWILRRMQSLDLSRGELFDVYRKEVRTVLEFAVPVWHSGLTKKQISEIEAVQKLAFRIILGGSYQRYSDACALLDTQTLEQRRLEICLRFAKKNVESENSLFSKPTTLPSLRRRSKVVQEYKCHKARFQRSSLPFLASLLNANC